MKKYLKSFKGFLKKHDLLPSYQEETLFLILVSLIVIAFVDPIMRQIALDLLVNTPRAAVYLGIFYIIYTTFFSYFRTSRQKRYMFYIAIIANVASVWTTGTYLLEGNGNILSYAIFALNALILLCTLILWVSGELDVDTIPNRSAQYSNVFYGSAAVILLVLVGKYGLAFSWPTLFSMSVGYAILFNKSVLGYMPQIKSIRKTNMDLIEKIVHESITIFNKEYTNTQGREVFCIITNGIQSRKAVIPERYLSDPNEFYERELAQENRTNQFVGLVTLGELTYKPLFRQTQSKDVFTVDIYPNNRKKGYQFIKFLDSGTNDVWDNQIIYRGRIKNLFIK